MQFTSRFYRYAAVAFGFAFLVFQLVKYGNYTSLSTRILPIRWRKQKILCFVLTSSPMHRERVPPLLRTWLPRCDRYELHTDAYLPFPSIVLHNSSSRDDTWMKLRLSLAYLYYNFLDYDWFVRSCDNTYLIVDNLRLFLQDKDPDQPHFYGEIAWHKNGTYNVGGAAYVLSRAVMKLLVERLLVSPTLCPAIKTHEDDVEIARCLANAQVFPEETRDEFGKQRFHQWHFSSIYEMRKKAAISFSSSAISFHGLSPKEMCFIDFLLYDIGDLAQARRQDNPRPNPPTIIDFC